MERTSLVLVFEFGDIHVKDSVIAVRETITPELVCLGVWVILLSLIESCTSKRAQQHGCIQQYDVPFI